MAYPLSIYLCSRLSDTGRNGREPLTDSPSLTLSRPNKGLRPTRHGPRVDGQLAHRAEVRRVEQPHDGGLVAGCCLHSPRPLGGRAMLPPARPSGPCLDKVEADEALSALTARRPGTATGLGGGGFMARLGESGRGQRGPEGLPRTARRARAACDTESQPPRGRACPVSRGACVCFHLQRRRRLQRRRHLVARNGRR